MKYHIILKTTRTKSGEARAIVTRFFDLSTMKSTWRFEFYETCKFFNSLEKLQQFIKNNYEIWK